VAQQPCEGEQKRRHPATLLTHASAERRGQQDVRVAALRKHQGAAHLHHQDARVPAGNLTLIAATSSGYISLSGCCGFRSSRARAPFRRDARWRADLPVEREQICQLAHEEGSRRSRHSPSQAAVRTVLNCLPEYEGGQHAMRMSTAAL
jgi:hypothetical protein